MGFHIPGNCWSGGAQPPHGLRISCVTRGAGCGRLSSVSEWRWFGDLKNETTDQSKNESKEESNNESKTESKDESRKESNTESKESGPNPSNTQKCPGFQV